MRAILMSAAALLALSGCGGATGEAEKGNAAGAAPAGQAGVPAAAVPAGLVPAYPGAVAVELPNLGAAGTDSRSGNATASETGDSVETVARFYRERFAAAGMPVRVDAVTATGGTMAIGRDGGQGAMLTFARPGARTRITVIQRR